MQAAARGRMQFLQEAASLAPALVQPAVKQKASWNIFGFLPLFGKKPAGWAVRLALIMAIAAAMLGTGGAAAVYAAQDSLPGETLYPVKTWGEDVLLTLASSPQTELNLNLEFAERRKSEIAALLYEDEELAAQSILRLQNHLQNAVRASELVKARWLYLSMQRLRDDLQYQQRLMLQLQLKADPAKKPFMEQSGETLQKELRIIEDRLQEQQRMQEQIQSVPEGGQGQPAGQPGKGPENHPDTGQMQQTPLPENPDHMPTLAKVNPELTVTPTPTATLFPTGGAMLPGNGNYQAGKEATPMPEEKQPGSGK